MLTALSLWGGFFLVTMILQIRNSSFSAELANDDASHYISSLMIRDYLPMV